MATSAFHPKRTSGLRTREFRPPAGLTEGAVHRSYAGTSLQGEGLIQPNTSVLWRKIVDETGIEFATPAISRQALTLFFLINRCFTADTCGDHTGTNDCFGTLLPHSNSDVSCSAPGAGGRFTLGPELTSFAETAMQVASRIPSDPASVGTLFRHRPLHQDRRGSSCLHRQEASQKTVSPSWREAMLKRL